MKLKNETLMLGLASLVACSWSPAALNDADVKADNSAVNERDRSVVEQTVQD